MGINGHLGCDAQPAQNNIILRKADHEIYWVKGGCLFTAKFSGKGPP